MAQSLWKQMSNDGPSIYYNPDFRNVIEYHLEWLKKRPSTVKAEVPMNLAMRNEYDLFSLLGELAIPDHLHWIVMRVNDMTSPTDFRIETSSLLIPDTNDIDTLRTTFTTVHKIS